MSRAWLIAFVVFAGCDCGRPTLPDGGIDDAGFDAGPLGSVTVQLDSDLGAVLLGETREVTGQIRNDTSRSITVSAFGTPTRTEFAVPTTTPFTIAANASGTFAVRFTPTELGPVIGAVSTRIDGVDGTLQLRGNGVGPRLFFPSSIDLGDVALYAGTTATATARFDLQNGGIGADALVTFQVVAIEGDVNELCVGDCSANSVVIEANTTLASRIELNVTTPGPRTFEVNVLSNDVAQPLRTVTVTANVVARPTCVATLTPTLDFGILSESEARRIAITFENVGTDVCEVTAANITNQRPALSRAMFFVDEPAQFPQVVAPGTALRVLINADSPGRIVPTQVLAELALTVNAPQPEVVSTLSANVEQSCLVTQVGPLDFGDVEVGCSSSARLAYVGPTAACRFEASFTSFLPSGPDFQTATNVMTRFTPTSAGDHRDVLTLFWSRNSQMKHTTVELIGHATQPGSVHVDRFAPRPLLDLLVVIDNTLGLAMYSGLISAKLPRLITTMQQRGVDFRLAVIRSGMTQPGVLRQTSAGDRWLTPVTPNIGARLSELISWTIDEPSEGCSFAALSALTLPNAATNGFRRKTAALSVLCIATFDDLDASLAPLVVELSPDRRFTWDAIAPLSASPTPSCIFTGNANAHVALTSRTGGQRLELCATNWDGFLDTIASRPVSGHTHFPLSVKPEAGSVSVTIDGLPSDSMNGAVWQYDAALNAVVFSAMQMPPTNAIVEVSVQPVCAP